MTDSFVSQFLTGGVAGKTVAMIEGISQTTKATRGTDVLDLGKPTEPALDELVQNELIRQFQSQIGPIVILTILWVIAFSAAISKIAQDDSYRNCGHSVATGVNAGLFAVGLSCLLHYCVCNLSDYWIVHLGTTCLVSRLTATQQLEFSKSILESVTASVTHGFAKVKKPTQGPDE